MIKKGNTANWVPGAVVFAVLFFFFVFSFSPFSTASGNGNKRSHQTEQLSDRSSDAALIGIASPDELVKRAESSGFRNFQSDQVSGRVYLISFNCLSESSLSGYEKRQQELISAPLRIAIFNMPSLHGDGLPA